MYSFITLADVVVYLYIRVQYNTVYSVGEWPPFSFSSTGISCMLPSSCFMSRESADSGKLGAAMKHVHDHTIFSPHMQTSLYINNL